MKIKSIFIIALAAMVGTGCKKSFLDVNTNPNVLPTATPNYVFTNALNTSTSNLINANETGSYWSGQWTQSNGYILSTTIFAYNFTNGDFNYWDGIYDNLEDYQYVINSADASGQPFLKGPAKVMKALLCQYMVDMYGSIPYTEALGGVGILAPKFDDQKVVYDSLIVLLDRAIVDLKANVFSSATVSSDIVFRGNTTNWIKLANSLKMRILVHQSRVTGKEAYITTEINKIVSEGTGLISGADVGVGGTTFYVATAGKLNPIYDRWGYDANGAKRALNNYPRLTQFLVNTLKSSADTFRLKRLGYANGGENGSNPGVSTKAEIADNYAGAPFGTSSGFLPSACASLGPSLLIKGQFGRPFILFLGAESQLLMAEAKQRFPAVTLPGTAQSYYEAGVTESFRALGAGTANAAALLTSGKNNADFAASTDKLAAIATQKWLALANYCGLEAWTEYRRNNLPVTPQSIQVVDAKRPLRFFYPNTESGSNEKNVKDQGIIDVFTTKLFWDVD
jgi:hypothetical protein